MGGLDWPLSREDGKPLRFWAQIGFRDFTGKAKSKALPGDGAIAFFAGRTAAEARVIYIADPGEAFSPVPDDLPPGGDFEFPFTESRDGAVASPLRPLRLLPLGVKAEATFRERQSAYQKKSKTQDRLDYQMFGLEREIQGGGYSPQAENHLLLQVTGGDGGLANFWLPPDALKRRDFEAAFITCDHD